MTETIESRTHIPCPCELHKKGSFYINEDGSGYCFSASCPHISNPYFFPDKVKEMFGLEDSEIISSPKKPKKIVSGIAQDIPERGITQKTCKEFGYDLLKDKNDRIHHLANYYDDKGNVLGQKVRTPNKNFETRGSIRNFYGKWLWESGEVLVITEGELDCLSYAQETNFEIPVVSLPFGAGSAEKLIKENLRWIESNFNKVVLAFDQDEAGTEAAWRAAKLFSPGVCSIAQFSEKDINDLLKANKKEEINNLIKKSKRFKPDHIKYVEDLSEGIRKPLEEGADTPFPTLTEITKGFRKQELWVFGAGVGTGKTFIFKTLALKLREQGYKVGLIFLEENPIVTEKYLVGIHNKKPFHVNSKVLDEKSIVKTEDFLKGEEGKSLVFYDNFGQECLEEIKKQIYWMVNADDVDYILFDHITSLQYGDSRKTALQNLNEASQELAKIVREKNVGMAIISHLRKLDGKGKNKSHEQGASITLDDLYGAAALKQWANFVFGVERNVRADTEDEKNTSTIICLKDRLTGQGTGRKIDLKYYPDKLMLKEVPKAATYGFKDEDNEEVEF